MPHQPIPARCAAARSTRALSSARTRARQPFALSTRRHRLQSGLEVGVVVLPGVPGDASGVRRALPGDGVVDQVAPGADDEGGRVRQGDLRIGGPGGLAVGEGHAAVQPRRLALLEVAPDVDERLGAGHLHHVEAGGAGPPLGAPPAAAPHLGRGRSSPWPTQVARSGRVRGSRPAAPRSNPLPRSGCGSCDGASRGGRGRDEGQRFAGAIGRHDRAARMVEIEAHRPDHGCGAGSGTPPSSARRRAAGPTRRRRTPPATATRSGRRGSAGWPRRSVARRTRAAPVATGCSCTVVITWARSASTGGANRSTQLGSTPATLAMSATDRPCRRRAWISPYRQRALHRAPAARPRSSMRSASASSCLVHSSSTDSTSAWSTARWKLPERAPRRALRIRPFLIGREANEMELLHTVPGDGSPIFATSGGDGSSRLFTLRRPRSPSSTPMTQAPEPAHHRPATAARCLHHIDDHGVLGLPIAQERDHAVATRRRPLHHALVTADPHAARRYAGGVTALLDGARRTAPPALDHVDRRRQDLGRPPRTAPHPRSSGGTTEVDGGRDIEAREVPAGVQRYRVSRRSGARTT